VSDLKLKFKLQERPAFESTRNILAILQYRERRVIPREDIQEGSHNWLASGRTFDDDWPDFVDRSRKLGIAVSPPVEEPLLDLPPLKSAEIQEHI